MSRISGKRRPITNRATIRDVAKLAGTSTASVSRSLNATNTVSPILLSRIQSAISHLNYVPHAGARALSNATSTIVNKSVAIVVLDGFNQSYLSLMFSLCSKLSERKLSLTLYVEARRERITEDIIAEMGRCNDHTIVFDRRQIPPRLIPFYPDAGIVFTALPNDLTKAEQHHIVDRLLYHILAAPSVSGVTCSIL